MMTPIDIAGHIAYIFMIVGQIFIANKSVKGFVLRVLGGIIWIILGGFLGLSSIILWSAVFCLVDIWGFYRWMQQRDTEYLHSMIVAPSNDIGGKR